jgi:Tol biopolymer transport system component
MAKAHSLRRLLGVTAMAFAATILFASPGGASPPGANGRVAYDSFDQFGNQNVLTANPDGSQTQTLVLNSCCPGWSHDGTKLTVPYMLDDGRIGTATVNADGSGYNPLPINDPTLNVGCGVWSPDDSQLACQGWDNFNPARNGIYTVSPVDGSKLTRLTNPGVGGSDLPGAYSQNGKRLVFARFDSGAPNANSLGLFVIKTDGTGLRRITPPGTIIQQGNTADWSRQGNQIIFSRHVSAGVHGSIWVINSDGSGLHEINVQGLTCGSSDLDPAGFGCHEPRWSPDGTKIIFAGNSQLTGVNIYTANVDGSSLLQLTADGGSDDPVWGTHPPVP